MTSVAHTSDVIQSDEDVVFLETISVKCESSEMTVSSSLSEPPTNAATKQETQHQEQHQSTEPMSTRSPRLIGSRRRVSNETNSKSLLEAEPTGIREVR